MRLPFTKQMEHVLPKKKEKYNKNKVCSFLFLLLEYWIVSVDKTIIY